MSETWVNVAERLRVDRAAIEALSVFASLVPGGALDLHTLLTDIERGQPTRKLADILSGGVTIALN